MSPINPSPELQLPEPTTDKPDQAPASLLTATIPVSQSSEPLTAAVSLAPPVPIRPPVAPVAAAPLQMRSFTDARAIRANIYDRVLQATREMQPLSNTVHTLRLRDVDYMDPDTVSKRDQKLAILNNLTPSRRLRGTWELIDNATGAVVDTRKSVVMRVPHFTDRGTFINKGVEYALKNQQRLLPGVYTRIQANGDVESHANIMPGKGPAHRYYLDPEKNTLKIKIGQGTVGLLPLLKIMGVSDRELQEAWGGHVYAANLRSNNAAEYAKLRSKFLSSSDLKKPLHEQDELLRAKFEGMELDPKVTASTLGKGYDRMSPDAVMAISKKLIAVAKGESDVDDRDSLAYQRFYGPEDLLEERIRRDKDGIRRNLLWKLSGKGNLKSMPPSVLTSQLQSALISSGLGLALEEINPTEILDKMTSTTRMGEGGIGSTDAIPVEARSVQPSMLNFIDPLRTPESSKVGIDVYMARGTMKGSDGKLYSQFTDAKTGQTTYKNPQEVAELTVGFPDALRSGEEYVPAMKQGRMEWVKPTELDIIVPQMEDSLNQMSNLIPMKSQVKGQRLVMATRMTNQALPVVDAEAPLVQSAIPGTKGNDSFERLYGITAGAVKADKPGRVLAVSDDEVRVRYDDGTEETHELYNNFPHNRKTLLRQSAVVQPGDAFKPGQLLARSNYTDATGAAALGKNARTAYMAWGGANFEDAIVISKGFAEKMKSEHMYQHHLETDDNVEIGKQKFLQLFPSTFDKRVLTNLDDQGVVKPGTEVQFGDPLVLGIAKKEKTHNRVHRKGATDWSDASVTWEHHDPGVVTDVAMTSNGPLVVVKSHSVMQVGDKLCYDPETKLLTKDRGWVNVDKVTLEDELATMNPATEELEWQRPTHLHSYDHDGLMYKLVTKHLDMLVTPNHKLWAAKLGEPYREITAEDFYNSRGRWKFRKDVKWVGVEKTYAPLNYDQDLNSNAQVLYDVSMDDWLEFLGFYIAEGWCCGGGYVKIGQFRSSKHWTAVRDVLNRMGLRWRYAEEEGRFEIGSKWLVHQLVDLGDSYTKRVPEYVQECSPRQINIFFDAYMAGDGHKGQCWEYSTSSEKLAYDLQLLCFKLGWAAAVREVTRSDNWAKEPHWRARVNRRHLRPGWDKGRVKKYAVSDEAMVPYSGKVHCVTVPNHILLVERRAKSYLSLNSGRYG